jgi:hypothetical protein
MTERSSKHLDSRRLEDGEAHEYGDYLVNLDDTEAIETSPFRQALEALKEFGMTEIIIGHPTTNFNEEHIYKDDVYRWFVTGIKKFPGTEKMVAEDLGGVFTVAASIRGNGERKLDFSFGAGEYEEYNPDDFNEIIWRYLEVVHGTLSRGRLGKNLPIKGSDQG